METLHCFNSGAKYFCLIKTQYILVNRRFSDSLTVYFRKPTGRQEVLKLKVQLIYEIYKNTLVPLINLNLQMSQNNVILDNKNILYLTGANGARALNNKLCSGVLGGSAMGPDFVSFPTLQHLLPLHTSHHLLYTCSCHIEIL